jgi:hypothetical protein
VELAAKRRVLGLVAVQMADAVFNAVPNQWVRDDLDHLGFPQGLRLVFPVVKSASATGLLVGLRRPRLGRLTAAALVAYFVAAMGFHVRARDTLLRYLPAAGMLAWSVMALRAYQSTDGQT